MTILFVQMAILTGEKVNNARKVFQAILVFVLCICLHFIVIGISGLKFKSTCMNKTLFLTTFNDN